MGFRDRVRAFFRSSPSPSEVYASGVLAGLFQAMEEPPVDAGPLGEIERDNPTLHRVVQTIATDAAGVELVLVRKSANGKKRTQIFDHPALNLLKHPNKFDSSFSYHETIYTDLLVYGNHYSWTDRKTAPGGVPTMLIRTPAHQMKVKGSKDPTKIVEKYIWDNGSGTNDPIEYKPEEIIHIKTKNLHKPYIGQSPLDPLRFYINLERSMQRFQWNRFKNQVTPNLILQSEQLVTGGPERKEELKNYIKRKMSGIDHVYEPLILDGERWGITIVPRATEDEIAYLAGLKWIRATYAMAFGVPPSQLADWSDSFRSNSREQTRDYYMEVLGAWHRLVLSYLNDIYLPRYWESEPNLEFEYDYSAVPALAFSRYEMAQHNEILIRNAIVTPDEARENMGFDPTGEEYMQKHYWNGKELGKEPDPVVPPGMAPGAAPADQEDPNPTEDPKDPGPQDNKQKSAVISMHRDVLTEDEIYLLLDEDDIIDEPGEKDKARRRFNPIVHVLVLGAISNWLRIHNKKDRIKDTDPEFIGFVDAQTIRLGNGVTDRTVEMVRSVIRQANSDGLPIREVKSMLAGVFEKRLADPELDRIARTEAHQASEGGAYLAMLADPDTTHKRWVTERDDRVRGPETGELRADHIGLDDQVVPKEAKFRDPISGALLRFPGDADGAITGADVINCRCTALAEVGDFLDRDDAWVRRDGFLATNEAVVKSSAKEFLEGMERRIRMRLDEQVRKRRTA